MCALLANAQGRGWAATPPPGTLLSLLPRPHRAPVGLDLPVAADVHLAVLGGPRLLQLAAALGVHHGGAVGVDLPAKDLAVLGSWPTGSAAGRPLARVPAGTDKEW